MSGIERIAAERRRQIEEEGWTPQHDAEHGDEEMARAAAVYAMPLEYRKVLGAYGGLWPRRWGFKGSNRIRELEKAGALIAAEIDRRIALGKNQ